MTYIIPCKHCGWSKLFHPKKKGTDMSGIAKSLDSQKSGYTYPLSKCPGFKPKKLVFTGNNRGFNIPPHIWM